MKRAEDIPTAFEVFLTTVLTQLIVLSSLIPSLCVKCTIAPALYSNWYIFNNNKKNNLICNVNSIKEISNWRRGILNGTCAVEMHLLELID